MSLCQYVVAICSHPSSSLATFIVLTYPQQDEIFCLLLILAAPPLDTRFALGPGFVYRKVAMLIQRSCCLLQRLPAAGPSLGSELAGTMLCGLQVLLLSVSHTRQLTLFCSPDTRPSPKTAVAYVCPSAGWLRGHVSGKGANVKYQLR